MDFDIKIWKKYRDEATEIANQIATYKDSYGNLILHRDILEGKIAEITAILKKCSVYLDNCKVNLPKPLWTYRRDDPTTHMSSPDFAYWHLVNV